MSLKDIKKQIDEAIANVPKVYQAGYDAGSNIDTDAIYQDGYNDGHSTGYDEGHDVGFTDGKKAEYDAFWDNYQQNTSRYQFAGAAWNNDTFKPKYNLIPLDAYAFFMYSGIEGSLKNILNDLNIILDTSNATVATAMFQYASKLTEIPCIDLRGVKTVPIGTIFYGVNSLETIEKLIINENISFNANAFQNATALTNIVIEGVIASDISFQWCHALSHDSLMNIINALKDYSADTSGITHTINFSLNNLAKLTAEEITMIENKGWNYG